MNEEIRHRLNISLTVWPISVAVRSKAGVCGRSLAGIVVSNPTGGMDICLLPVLYVFRWTSLCPTEFDVFVCVSLSVIRCNNNLLHTSAVKILENSELYILHSSFCSIYLFICILIARSESKLTVNYYLVICK
jgi:hypothetical protein